MYLLNAWDIENEKLNEIIIRKLLISGRNNYIQIYKLNRFFIEKRNIGVIIEIENEKMWKLKRQLREKGKVNRHEKRENDKYAIKKSGYMQK